MRILLDECIPLPVKSFLASKGFDVDHVMESDLLGLTNRALYERAKERYQIFIINDRHFRHPLLFPPTQSLGIIYLRITPNHSRFFIEGLDRFICRNTLESIVGRKVVIRRNDHEFVD